MRLDQRKDDELAQRKGLTTRTIIQFSWLAFSAFLAYLALNYLFASEQLSYEFFYTTLLVPRSVPQPLILAVLIFILVAIMQFFLVLGYAFASPKGRARTGDPSPYSDTYDSTQDDYRS